MQKTDKGSESLLWGAKGPNRYYGAEVGESLLWIDKTLSSTTKNFLQRKEKKKTDHNSLKKRINKK